MAAAIWGKMSSETLRSSGGVVPVLIRRSVEFDERADHGESDLASYVLFEPEFINRLIELGYASRERVEEAINEARLAGRSRDAIC